MLISRKNGESGVAVGFGAHKAAYVVRGHAAQSYCCYCIRELLGLTLLRGCGGERVRHPLKPQLVGGRGAQQHGAVAAAVKGSVAHSGWVRPGRLPVSAVSDRP